MKRAFVSTVVLGAFIAASAGCRVGPDESDSLPANAGCYVCHMSFVDESITKVHLVAEVKCTDCHGPSADHANDEDIGATPPDVVFARDEINPHCRSCHASHDAAPELVISSWQKRMKSRPVFETMLLTPVCTDCHGSHKIARGSGK